MLVIFVFFFGKVCSQTQELPPIEANKKCLLLTSRQECDKCAIYCLCVANTSMRGSQLCITALKGTKFECQVQNAIYLPDGSSNGCDRLPNHSFFLQPQYILIFSSLFVVVAI